MTTGATTQHVLALPPLSAPAPGSDSADTGTNLPESVDMAAILADVRAQQVSAPADQVPALRQLVADAKADGHEVSFVVLPGAQFKFTIYRDIASQIQSDVGGTVIVLGANSVGSSSPHFSRVVQEEATDNLTMTNPPLAARQMWDQMSGPSLDWTAITLVLIVLVVIGAVVARLRQVRSRVAGSDPVDTDPVAADQLDVDSDDADTADTASSGSADRG